MGPKVITKICSACGAEYMAAKIEVELLQLLRLCPACLDKWYINQNEKKVDEMYKNVWTNPFRDSSIFKKM